MRNNDYNIPLIQSVQHVVGGLILNQKIRSLRHHNKLAIEYIEGYSKKRIDQALDSITHVSAMSNISGNDINQLINNIKNKARIGIHFHPYRLNNESKNVLELLIESGIYKNQFETKISNGSLTAFEGGKRDLWENVLFNDLFSSNEISISERPKYGSLDLLGHSDGPSPRFGSCYFLLKPKLSKYSTFTYFDSYTNPKEKGTLNFFEEILSSLLLECFERGYALGEKNVRPHQLLKKINDALNSENFSLGFRPPQRNLNHYIEAQIHTQIFLETDVDILMADPSFKNTEYEKRMHQLCDKYQIELKWNQGFELDITNVPKHFRGTTMPILAAQIAIDKKINAHVIGQAEMNYTKEITNQEQLQSKLQELKYLWHTVVNYGKPIGED